MTECWGYAREPQPQTWTGNCASREEAIAEGRRELELEPGEVFWIMRGTPVRAEDVVPCADWLLDHMAETAGELCGEVAEDWPEATAEAHHELEKLIADWVRKHCPIHFWQADGKPEPVA